MFTTAEHPAIALSTTTSRSQHLVGGITSFLNENVLFIYMRKIGALELI